jgi:hypothetical protein
MYFIGFAAVIVSPMLFPDETDYRVLTSLPLKRVELFAAKLTALFIVSTAAILIVNAVLSVTLPAVIGGRWAPHPALVRVPIHWLTACVASAWTVSAVMALQGACLLVVPERWRLRVSSAVQASVFLMLLVSVPFFVRLTGRTVNADTVSAAPQIFLPPIWFLGLERWLLDGSAAAGYARAAAAAGVAWAVTLSVVGLAFVSLFRSAESLAGTAGNQRVSSVRRRAGRWLRTRTIVPSPQAAIIGFALRGLTRSRLHQFIFAVVLGGGLAMLAGQIAWMVEGRTLAATRPEDAMSAAIAAPLLVTLSLVLGLRAAFLLPLDRGAGWLFRLVDDPRTRGPGAERCRDGVQHCRRRACDGDRAAAAATPVRLRDGGCHRDDRTCQPVAGRNRVDWLASYPLFVQLSAGEAPPDLHGRGSTGALRFLRRNRLDDRARQPVASRTDALCRGLADGVVRRVAPCPPAYARHLSPGI